MPGSIECGQRPGGSTTEQRHEEVLPVDELARDERFNQARCANRMPTPTDVGREGHPKGLATPSNAWAQRPDAAPPPQVMPDLRREIQARGAVAQQRLPTAATRPAARRTRQRETLRRASDAVPFALKLYMARQAWTRNAMSRSASAQRWMGAEI